jgi:uncharacterized protein involved in outer membrane biogenesis
MADFNVDDFVATIERLGLLLAAVPLSDGTVRLTQWRMPDAVIHAQEIENLWTTQVGDQPDRIEQIAAHVMQRTSQRSVIATAHKRSDA